MPKPSETHPLRLSIQEQAELVDRLVERCAMRDGKIADTTCLTISAEEADHLVALANRLHLISPYEAKIRKMVTGQ